MFFGKVRTFSRKLRLPSRELAPRNTPGRELGHVRREQAGDVNDGRAVRRERLDVERLDHRLQGGVPHGPVNGLRAVRHHLVGDAAQEDPVSLPRPADHPGPELLAAVAGPRLRLRDPRYEQERLTELVPGDLVVERVTDPVGGEHAPAVDRAGRHHLPVGPDLRLSLLLPGRGVGPGRVGGRLRGGLLLLGGGRRGDARGRREETREGRPPPHRGDGARGTEGSACGASVHGGLGWGRVRSHRRPPPRQGGGRRRGARRCRTRSYGSPAGTGGGRSGPAAGWRRP